MADAALAVMVGHAFPIFLGFKGGKAVATFFGAFLYLTPIPALAALIVFVITVTVTRYVSAGSVLASATFPLGVWLIQHSTLNEVLAAVIGGGHRRLPAQGEHAAHTGRQGRRVPLGNLIWRK